MKLILPAKLISPANLLLSLALLTPRVHASEPVQFNEEVRPILSNNCFHCHGPDEEDRQADVRLDVSGGVDLEELVARITSNDPDLKMPPPESHKHLKAKQIELLKRWVEQGAAYEEHWAFVPPAIREVPLTGATAWSDQPLDRFVLAKIETKGQRPNVQASKRTLIRRLTFDLIGLPPTLTEIEAFLADDSEAAYERVVDRLLASPHYGEHMTRFWLDLVRFADTNGLHHDHYREMTPYRDWVIRAFNENLPLDDFIKYQVAGDLYETPTLDQQIASGFNRLHLIIDRGTALPAESFNRNVVDRVSAVGTAFLGLTLQCAVCHDHKYDPITQKDFYQLYAFFNNFAGEPETGFRKGTDFYRGLQPPYLELPSAEQKQQLEKFNAEIKRLESQLARSKKQQLQTSLPDQPKNETADPEALTKQLESLKASRDQLRKQIPATLVMKERAEPRPAHVLIRGVYDQFGEQVERDTPSFLPPMQEKEGLRTRKDFAEWLVEPDHPLTARVAVNRFWQQLFGVGLVKTSEDFGAQGQVPSHPKLLDFLAVKFVESGWDVKALMRRMVLSQTYRQSSQASRESYVNDPENRLLARGSRFRLDAEVIRDQVLSVTGLLNDDLYGKSVKPPQPDGLWEVVTMPSSYPKKYDPDSGNRIYRRSVYTFWKRSIPPPQMSIFDAPTRESCIARRERTNTPLQALLLMNESQFFAAASYYAQQLLGREELADRERISLALESITSQPPSPATLDRMMVALKDFRQFYATDEQAARELVASCARNLDRVSLSSDQPSELAAWTMVIHSILNLDQTKTHE